jgi:hypothetical protein
MDYNNKYESFTVDDKIVKYMQNRQPVIFKANLSISCN